MKSFKLIVAIILSLTLGASIAATACYGGYKALDWLRNELQAATEK
jgi:hypothetical protein